MLIHSRNVAGTRCVTTMEVKTVGGIEIIREVPPLLYFKGLTLDPEQAMCKVCPSEYEHR